MLCRWLFLASGFVLFSIIASTRQPYDPCCSFPCQHNGVCVSFTEQRYECDCTRTGYYGSNCQIPFFTTKLKQWIKPSKKTLNYLLSNFSWGWKIINNVPVLRRGLMKALLKFRIGFISDPSPYNALTNYASWESYFNTSVYKRALPSVPVNCPTPMGTKGKKILPDVDLLIEKFFLRRHFKPCPRRTSMVFPFFAQHFTHQFFKTDSKKGFPFQWGSHALDLSHIYGESYERQHKLRSHINGKMKVSIINGEVYPPHINEANVTMDGIEKVPEKYRFALGHRGFTMQPFLLFFGTIWLREHNRVCDILKEEHPFWDDERLFQTARLILTGETMKIVIEDYVQHLSGYNYKLVYDPSMLHDFKMSYYNEISIEFQLLYRWHALMPDHFTINSNTYGIRNLIFNPQPLVDSGMATWVFNATNQFAGKVAGGRSQGLATIRVARQAILDARKMRLQPLNKYREKFGLKPYKSFTEFIADPDMAKELEEMYGDVDAMEFFPGIFLEERTPPVVFAQTITEVGSPFSLRGIFSNPISSPEWWKESTFGGKRGFDIVKSSTLKDLICQNVEGCPHVSFEVPDDITYVPLQTNSKSDNSSYIIMKINRGDHVTDELLQPDSSSTQREVAAKQKTEL